MHSLFMHEWNRYITLQHRGFYKKIMVKTVRGALPFAYSQRKKKRNIFTFVRECVRFSNGNSVKDKSKQIKVKALESI